MDRGNQAELRWAFVQGQWASAEGKSIYHCPYRNSDETKELHDRWITGWRLAFAERMKFRKA
jgi:ribosome modulation factor